MFQNIDKDRQYIKWNTKNENILYCFVVEFRDESMYWDKNFIHIPNLVDDKIIFLNATHMVSIYNRNTLTHIKYLYHFTWRHSLDPTSLRYSLADKLLVKFSCRLLHLLLRFQKNSNVDLFLLWMKSKHKYIYVL